MSAMLLLKKCHATDDRHTRLTDHRLDFPPCCEELVVKASRDKQLPEIDLLRKSAVCLDTDLSCLC